MPSQEKHLYEFGPFRIDTVERLLFRGEEMIPLGPRVIDTLLVLVSHPGRLLEKDELMKLVWPDSFVEEGALAQNVSLLRKVFDERGAESQFIETVPKRGYRFVAPVKELQETDVLRVDAPRPVQEPTPSNAPEPAPKRSPRLLWTISTLGLLTLCVVAYSYLTRKTVPITRRINSLVILPLRNSSNDPTQEYFTEGMTEALINSVAKIEALRVISWTSAMTYKGVNNKKLPQIAQELNVAAVVEGSVLRSGGRVRIIVELFEASTERQLWSDSYERDLSDVLSLQSEVATAIAREIQVKLTAREKQQFASSRTVDPEAYLAYSRGRYYWNIRTPEGLQKSIDYFNSAIAKDPSYAPPHAGLADAYSLLGSIGVDVLPPRRAMPKAEAAAMEAVRLDETLAEGHASLGYARLSYDWDLDTAEREFKRAIELNPGYATAHHWYAHYFLARKEPERALAEIKKAQELDPISHIINTGVGWCLYHARRYDEAIQQYRAALEMNPNFYIAHCTLGMAYEGKQLYSDAISEYTKASTLPGSRTFWLAGLGRAYALSGKLPEARQVLDQLENLAKRQYVPAVYLAAVYSALGDKDRSVGWALKAYDERSDYMVYLKIEPWADSLRIDPRFQHLLERIAKGR